MYASRSITGMCVRACVRACVVLLSNCPSLRPATAGAGSAADGKGGASGNGANGAGDAAMSLEDKIKEIKDALNYMEKDEL